MNSFNAFLALVARVEAQGPFVCGIVFKTQTEVVSFGDVPKKFLSLAPLPEFERAVEDRPGLDEIVPVVRVHSPKFWDRIMNQRNLGLGEAFIADEFTMEQGSVWHLVAFFIRNNIDLAVKISALEKARLFALYVRWRWNHSANEDIADHYDMGDDVMNPMLGRTGVYSCGYVLDEGENLDQLQENKLNLIFSKLRLKPGDHVLDTGCGNGGALIHAAQGFGVTGEGFSNSHHMVRLARENVKRNELTERLRIALADFSCLERFPSESFDAIYETGVWEHLPYEDYRYVMFHCHRILKPGGRMLIHSMGDVRFRHVRDEYVQKYIFRDSNQIILSKLLVEAEKLAMMPIDIENLGRHYYYTLWHWHDRLTAAADGVRDKTKLKVQQYFLQCGMAQSRFGAGAVYHVLLYKDRRTFTPVDHLWRITRHSMQRPALRMQSNAHNDIKNTAPDADPDKFTHDVYRRPSLSRRLSRLLSLLFRFYH